MPNSTANYGLLEPLVNSATDSDLWGGYLNTTITDLDGLMLTALTLASSVQTTSFNVTAPTSGSTTTGSSNMLYVCETNGGAITATFPAASTCGGMMVSFWVNGTNTVTLTSNGADVFVVANSSMASLVLTSGQVINIVAIGGGWLMVAQPAVSTAGFAPLASPTFTGTPAAPTAAALTSNTQLATTAYADASSKAALLIAAGGIGSYSVSNIWSDGGGTYTNGSNYAAGAILNFSYAAGTWKCVGKSTAQAGGWGGNANYTIYFFQRIS